MLAFVVAAAVVGMEVWTGREWESPWGLLALPLAFLVIGGAAGCFWLMERVSDWAEGEKALGIAELMDRAQEQRDEEALERHRDLGLR
jgi:hypothetical protein